MYFSTRPSPWQTLLVLVFSLTAGCQAHFSKTIASSSSSAATVTPVTENQNRRQTQGTLTPIRSKATSEPQNILRRLAGEVRHLPTLIQRTIYFPFDSAQISPDDCQRIKIHARFLKNHPHLKISLIGHADHRGNSSYNLRLGQKRAESVAKALEHAGISAKRITILSMGAEQPRTMDRNEKAWLNSRRVEIRYG